jgi:hypothetical protein
METNQQRASMRQIHAAIDHLYKGELESAITLAHAAEGVLPGTDKPHLFQKIQKLSESLPPDPSGANALRPQNWIVFG